MFLVLHEIAENLVDRVLDELRRVLKSGSVLLIVDKIRFEASSPSEGLAMLVEDVYHLAIEYARNVKPWGLRDPDKYIAKVCVHGFEPVSVKIAAIGKRIDGEEFLHRWGRETARLLEEIEDETKRHEISELIQRIKTIGSRYGYGSYKLLIAVFKPR